jgi:peptidoglycan/LPS O-acetylase OafA/YrhL
MTAQHLAGRWRRRSATGKERISALDGLRAVALLIIMGYHFGVGWLQGGFFSLDIFYVLSGYLITGLLLGEYRRRGRIVLSAFWLRRARRLLPALLIVLVAVTLMIRFAEPAGLYPDFRMSALSALFYFSNWWQIAANSNYFVATGAVSPLTHTWSLAVEEQFYLVWPLVSFAVLHLSGPFRRGVRNLLVVSTVGALASAIEMALLYSPSADTTRLYFGTDTHAQSILIGAVLACVMTMIQMRRGEEGMAPVARTTGVARALLLVGVAGFAGTFTLTYALVGTTPFVYRGGLTLSALSAAAIIIGAVCVPRGPIARLLSLRVLVWIGTVSYGAYLWHYPVFVYFDSARTGLTGLGLLVVRVGCTLALAAASFYLVERPVMYGTFWRSVRAIAPATAVTVGTVAVVFAGSIGAATASPSVPPVASPPARPGTVPVIVAGDSTALTLGLALGYAAKHDDTHLDVQDMGIGGCGVAEGRTFLSEGVSGNFKPACDPGAPAQDQWPALLEGWIHQYRAKVVVMLAGRWEVYDRTNLAGQVTNITHPAYARYVKQQIERFVSIATAAGCRVVMLTAPYFDSGEQANGQPLAQDAPVRVRDYNALVRQVAAAHPQTVSLVDLNAIVSPQGHYTESIGTIPVRAPDGVHFPFFAVFNNTAHDPDTYTQFTQFARWIGPKILPAIEQAAHS